MYAFCTCESRNSRAPSATSSQESPDCSGLSIAGFSGVSPKRATTQSITTSRRALTFRLAFDASMKQLLPRRCDGPDAAMSHLLVRGPHIGRVVAWPTTSPTKSGSSSATDPAVAADRAVEAQRQGGRRTNLGSGGGRHPPRIEQLALLRLATMALEVVRGDLGGSNRFAGMEAAPN